MEGFSGREIRLCGAAGETWPRCAWPDGRKRRSPHRLVAL